MKLKYLFLNLILFLQPILIESMEEKEKDSLKRLKDMLTLGNFETVRTESIVNIIQKLIKEKVNFNNEGDEILENAIKLSKIYSKKYNLDNIVKLLIEAGAYKKGDALNVAVDIQDKEFVKLLLENGANIYNVNKNNLNALQIAAEWKRSFEEINHKDSKQAKEIYEMIEKYGLISDLIKAIKAKDINNVKKYTQEIIKYNLKYKDTFGNNLLHYAVEAKDPYVFKIILSLWPAAINEKNKAGKSPMELIVGTWQEGLKYVKEAAKETKK